MVTSAADERFRHAMPEYAYPNSSRTNQKRESAVTFLRMSSHLALLPKSADHCWPLQATPHQDMPVVVQRDHTADILAQVDPKNRDIHRSTLHLS